MFEIRKAATRISSRLFVPREMCAADSILHFAWGIVLGVFVGVLFV